MTQSGFVAVASVLLVALVIPLGLAAYRMVKGPAYADRFVAKFPECNGSLRPSHRYESAVGSPQQALAFFRRPGQWCGLPLHLPAHLLPRRQQAHRLEQPRVPERRHAARAVGTAGRAPAAVREED